MLRTIVRVLWPDGVFEKLGRLLATLSVLSLLNHALEFGFAASLILLLEYDGALVDVLVGWLYPYVAWCVEAAGRIFAWHIALHPHWKHFFVLLSGYMLRAAAVNYAYGYRSTAGFCAIWEISVAP